MSSRLTLGTLACACACALSLGVSPADAQPTSPHEAAATAAYEAGDLDTALREFEAAYTDTQRPDLLYVIGRLHSERKDCAKAIGFFQRYLATKPGPTQAEAAQAEITTCQATLDAQRPPGPGGGGEGGGGGTGAGTSATTGSGGAALGGGSASPGGAAITGERSRSFTRDKLGLTLLVGGVLVEGAAVVLYVQARAAQCGDPVCTELSYEEYLDAEDEAKQLRLGAIVAAGVGAVLLGGGIYRYATRDGKRREPSLSFTPTRDGAALTYTGRF